MSDDGPDLEDRRLGMALANWMMTQALMEASVRAGTVPVSLVLTSIDVVVEGLRSGQVPAPEDSINHALEYMAKFRARIVQASGPRSVS